MTDPLPIRRRTLPDRIRYFARKLTERAAEADDMELGGLAIALGMVANDAEQEATTAASDDGLRKQLAEAEAAIAEAARTLSLSGTSWDGPIYQARDILHAALDGPADTAPPAEPTKEPK